MSENLRGVVNADGRFSDQLAEDPSAKLMKFWLLCFIHTIHADVAFIIVSQQRRWVSRRHFGPKSGTLCIVYEVKRQACRKKLIH